MMRETLTWGEMKFGGSEVTNRQVQDALISLMARLVPGSEGMWWNYNVAKMPDMVTELRAQLAEAQAELKAMREQEPVAWLGPDGQFMSAATFDAWRASDWRSQAYRPLFTAPIPPKREAPQGWDEAVKMADEAYKGLDYTSARLGKAILDMDRILKGQHGQALQRKRRGNRE